jgi:hypothetical protein
MRLPAMITRKIPDWINLRDERNNKINHEEHKEHKEKSIKKNIKSLCELHVLCGE